MGVEDIKYLAWSKFFMEFVIDEIISNQRVLIFKGDANSDITGFIDFFKAYKIYNSHNEDDLYAVIPGKEIII